MSMVVPIYRVLRDGRVERLGEWRHGARRLALEHDGFPLLGAGEHEVPGELPWVFWDMCPAGYLGRQLQRRLPELGLQPDPARWSAEDALRVLSTHGQDVSGNLILGDESVERFRAWQFDNRDAVAQVERILGEVFEPGDDSSLGGERPKLVGYRANGEGYFVKFSPVVTTSLGRRWADLLEVEALCARVLRDQGLSATQVWTSDTPRRRLLHVERYDRLRNRGRAGATTLYWYAMERLGDVSVPVTVVLDALIADGHLAPAAVDVAARAQAFSEAIGNTDTHLGNYGLVFDEAGRAELAPFYDVLPMALAPRHDELPDERLVPRSAPIDERVHGWVRDLIERVEQSENVSREFVATWRRYIGV